MKDSFIFDSYCACRVFEGAKSGLSLYQVLET